jgi:hypothetical protein
MMRTATAVSGKHLYAIVPASFGEVGQAVGVNGSPVYTIQNEGLAAVVSDLAVPRLRPERRHLAAHSEVLQSILAQTTPLPIAFGVVAGSQEDVQILLKRHREVFENHLTRLENKVEMSVRVSLDLPNVFEYFMRTNEDLRSVGKAMFAGGREPSQNEKIELGRMCEAVLTHERETMAQQLEDSLETLCSETIRAELRQEHELVNLTCLVEKNRLDEFMTVIENVGELYPDDFAIKISGPFAPHNFVELRLNS